MTEDSVVFSKETIRFYQEYTGISNYQELKHHLIGIQHKLAKVAISMPLKKMAFTDYYFQYLARKN